MINKIFKRILLLMLFLALESHIFAQAKIEIRIDNLQDSIFYLLRYKGEKTYAVDTSFVKDGKTVFKHKMPYKEGVYLLINTMKQPVLQIFMGKDQTFSIHVKDIMNPENIEVRGSKESAVFYEIMYETKRINMNIRALNSEIQYFPQNKQIIDSLRLALNNYQKLFLSKDTTSFLNIYVKSMLEIIIPDSLIDNEIKSREYYVEHYWDNITLDDPRILTYPLIDNKLKTFFDNIILPEPEIINQKIDFLISKTNDCQEVRDYLLWYFYAKYYSPEYMNLDPVYIHLVEKYFSKIEMERLTESIRQAIIERAEYLSHLLLGTSTPPLLYPNLNDSLISLYKIQSPFTVIYFYDHDCQLCKKEKRILKQLLKTYPEIKVYAVDLHEDQEEWKKNTEKYGKNWINVYYSRKNGEDLLSLYDIRTTPIIYLLDSEKRIMAKRIKAEQIKDFVTTK